MRVWGEAEDADEGGTSEDKGQFEAVRFVSKISPSHSRASFILRVFDIAI